MLVATYEALLRKAIQEFKNQLHTSISDCTANHGQMFWEWVKETGSDENKDQISRFWATALIYLHTYVGYFFAIRSGNWMLRNSCLKLVTPLFFAFSHNKYEQLSTSAILDTYTFPKEIIDRFKNGEWTVSCTGKPFHNLALDEAHETEINLNLKQLTSRPSTFKTVKLADFMAYLTPVVEGFRKLSNKNRVSRSTRFICQRSTILETPIQKATLFNNEKKEVIGLLNIFTNKPKKLDSQAVDDLLSFHTVGKDRMKT